MIRQSRSIAGDEVGVRAYSTAIAAIRAFPRPLRSAADVTALPGCDGKMAALFEAWKASGGDDDDDDGADGGDDYSTGNSNSDSDDTRLARRTIPAVRELQRSPTFRALAALAGIWGVGSETARTLYYRHGLRSRDQVAAQHWNRLSRVQQIGVKYYDELRAPIARPEMESVAARIAAHAAALAPGTQCLLVGGYRRGQAVCHDVDVLLSHPVEDALPADLLWRLLLRLEAAHLITHTLLVSAPSASKARDGQGDGQGEGPGDSPGDPHWRDRKGGLFDGLDKALVVWQTAPGQPHRRVDIVVAPAVAIGTALLGWTGDTTFQRDLRLYCEKERGWRFASDGVRCGAQRVPATAGWRPGETWADVERRVMEAIGIGWRPPEMRCTG